MGIASSRKLIALQVLLQRLEAQSEHFVGMILQKIVVLLVNYKESDDKVHRKKLLKSLVENELKTFSPFGVVQDNYRQSQKLGVCL